MKQRIEQAAVLTPPTALASDEEPVALCLTVKWHLSGPDGGTKIKVNRLKLKELENVDKLGETGG